MLTPSASKRGATTGTTRPTIDLPAGGMLGFRKNDGRFFIHDEASAANAQVPFNRYR